MWSSIKQNHNNLNLWHINVEQYRIVEIVEICVILSDPLVFPFTTLLTTFLSLYRIYSLQNSRPRIKCLSHLLQSFLEFCRPRAILPRTQALLVLGIFVRPSCQLSQCPCKVGILWAWLASVHIRRGWEATQHHQATHSDSEWTHTRWKCPESENTYKLKLKIFTSWNFSYLT